VILLEHTRASLAQLLDLRIEAARDDADEARHDHEAADRHDEHRDPEPPALVAAHRAGIEGAHEVAPEDVEEVALGLVGRVQRQGPHDEGEQEDEDESRSPEQADEGDGALRHPGVEAIAEALAERRVGHGGGSLVRVGC